jgi:hypothetical protein
MSRSWSLGSALLILSPFMTVSFTNAADVILLVCMRDDKEQALMVLTE